MNIANTYLENLSARIANSDEKAFRQLFDSYYPRLLNYVFVIVKNHEAAEDIVLEVFNSIWERREKLVEVDRVESYLYVCARNKTLDHHRKNSKMMNVSFSEPNYKEYITHQNPESKLLSQELRDIIDHAILDLPEKTRLVYRLVKEDGLKYQEAADIMGTSVKTINNQLLKAVKSVREHVTAYLSEDQQKPIMSIIRGLLL